MHLMDKFPEFEMLIFPLTPMSEPDEVHGVFPMAREKNVGLVTIKPFAGGAVFRTARRESGAFEERRRRQALAWMWDSVNAGLMAGFRAHPAVRAALADTLRDVGEGRVAPSAAARALLDLLGH